jgi:hypothetical protein
MGQTVPTPRGECELCQDARAAASGFGIVAAFALGLFIGGIVGLVVGFNLLEK